MNLRQGLFSDEDKVSYLRNRLDFEEVLEGLGLDISHQLGAWIMCHCPNPINHSNGDTNPSFGFNVDELRYNCFVCGGGSLLSLIQEQLEIEEEDALMWLKQMSTFEPAKSNDLVAKIEKIIYPVQVLDVMPEYPDSAVFKYQFIHPYLLERGISRDVIIEMNVGFDQDHLGIVIPHWWKGKLRGWQVRHLLVDTVNGKDIYYCPTCGEDNSPTVAKKSKQVAKYNNTIGFPKKYTLYNYDNVVAEGHKDIILVESPMSVLYLKSHGFPNVVGTFGQFNIEQATSLYQFNKIYIWPDNDPAGSENLERAVDELLHRSEVRIIPCVNKVKGDPGDVAPEDIYTYLDASLSPTKWSLFKRKMITLDEALANTKS